MARLYSNENFLQPVVDELRRWGHDVLTVLETIRRGADHAGPGTGHEEDVRTEENGMAVS